MVLVQYVMYRKSYYVIRMICFISILKILNSNFVTHHENGVNNIPPGILRSVPLAV